MTGARVRLFAIVMPLVSSSLALLAWSQPWVEVRLGDGRVLTVGGDVAAPAIPPLALAALALVGALALAGVVFRVTLGVLQSLLGTGIVASGLLAITDPVQSAAASITASTGVEGVASVRELVDQVSMSWWPLFAIVAGALAIVMGVFIATTASRWPTRTRRFDTLRLAPAEASPTTAPTDNHETWDALSGGDDPTSR